MYLDFMAWILSASYFNAGWRQSKTRSVCGSTKSRPTVLEFDFAPRPSPGFALAQPPSPAPAGEGIYFVGREPRVVTAFQPWAKIRSAFGAFKLVIICVIRVMTLCIRCVALIQNWLALFAAGGHR